MLRDLFSLFPAHAGVILASVSTLKVSPAFPRTCGGDPVNQVIQTSSTDFSPHMRGLSLIHI